MKKALIRMTISAVAMTFAIGTGASVLAADIPCSTAKLIVPWGAGGDTDILFRTFVDIYNKKEIKPALQVVNIGGQGGNKGAKEAVGARPDGCTLFAIHQSAITSYFTGRVDFTWDAFEPLTVLTRTPAIIGAHPSVPYNDAKGMVAYAKEHPGEVLAGVTLGSTSQFFFLLMEDAADVKFKHIPYEGTRERMTALLANNINLGEINLAAAKQYIQTNELKALGISSEKRYPQLPELPTLKEQGYDVVYGTDRGLMLPKDTPNDVLAHYSEAAKTVTSDPEYIKAIEAKGTEIIYMSPEATTEYFKKTYAHWERVAKKLGFYKRKN